MKIKIHQRLNNVNIFDLTEALGAYYIADIDDILMRLKPR